PAEQERPAVVHRPLARPLGKLHQRQIVRLWRIDRLRSLNRLRDGLEPVHRDLAATNVLPACGRDGYSPDLLDVLPALLSRKADLAQDRIAMDKPDHRVARYAEMRADLPGRPAVTKHVRDLLDVVGVPVIHAVSFGLH